MRGRVGLVVPAWFAAETPVEQAAALLLTTLQGSETCLDARDIVVVADGSPVAAEAGRQVRDLLGAGWPAPFRLLELPENRGKGGAIVAGIRSLADPSLEWICIRDADGDHFLDDLPHLYRAGEQAAAENPGRPVCVIGRRSGVHAPLGWLRGEYELLLNDAIVDALALALGREGRAWDSRYLADRVPDLQSGYKLYSRAAAEHAAAVLESEPPGLLRTGMEIVPFVSLALAGAVFAEAERKAYFDQPVTSYGRLDLAQFYASKLAWAFGRCGVPPETALVILDGALARRPLYTDPDGRSSVLRMRSLVLEGLEMDPVPAPLMRSYL
jgi:hypothetical protein